ncbi:MAG: hypothetical protein L0Y55_15355, partial [Anaerolineales bacterium]|nr:hypothetical protein [Anaerolineales bacterium]
MQFRYKQLNFILGALLVLTLLVVACGAPAAQPTAAPPTVAPAAQPTAAPPTVAPAAQPTAAPPTVAPTAAPTQAAAGVTLTDSAGRNVTLTALPTRIISLAPSTTEIACAVGACEKLVGIDQFSD